MLPRGFVANEKADVAAVLDRIRESQAFVDEFEADAEVKDAPDEATCVLAEEAARRKARGVDDEDSGVVKAMKELFEDETVADTKPDDDLERFKPREGRYSLHGALRGHENLESGEDDLVRLLCWLRMAPNGCDGDIIQQPLRTRKLILSQPKKWHNMFRHQMAHADAVEKLPTQRKSRQSAWVQATEKARMEFPTLPSSVAISTGDLVAVSYRGEWRVGLVLTMWRYFKKGTGAQQVCHEIPRGGLHSARVVIMSGDNDEPRVFTCGSGSVAVVLPHECIGMRLDTPSMKKKVGLDGLKVLLPEDCWGVRAGAHSTGSSTNSHGLISIWC